MRPRIAANVPRFMMWRSGKRIGAPDILPASFRNAMTDPENVMAPMAMPKPISTRLIGLIRPSSPKIPNAAGLRNAAAATSTAAMPTSEWNAATSCGISVMAILRAVTQPMPPPIAMAPRISGSDATSCVTKVVTTAISMPAMPNRLPRCDVAGDDSPRRAKMKKTPEIK